jgi:hypothetical protein
MRIMKFILLFLCCGVLAASGGKNRPKFSDYPVEQIYKGRSANPLLSKDQRTFRTVIREGAKSDVEYAGHYTVPRFGCGASCNGFYVVDSKTGRVHDGFGVTELPGSWLESHHAQDIPRMEFHPNSRLLKINGCHNEKECGFYDYVMVDGVGLKLIYKELLPKQFQ